MHLQGEMKKNFLEKPVKLPSMEIYEDSESNGSPVMPDYVAPSLRSRNFYGKEVASTASTDEEEVFDFTKVAPPPGLGAPSLLATQPMFWEDLEKFTSMPIQPAA